MFRYVVFTLALLVVSAFNRSMMKRGVVLSRHYNNDPSKDFMKSVSDALDKAGGIDGIMNKTGEAAKKAAQLAQDAAAKAKQLNEEYKIVDKAVAAAQQGAEAAKKFNEEYKLTDKAVEAAKQAADAATKKIKDASK